jgi:hypothetical protein
MGMPILAAVLDSSAENQGANQICNLQKAKQPCITVVNWDLL